MFIYYIYIYIMYHHMMEYRYQLGAGGSQCSIVCVLGCLPWHPAGLIIRCRVPEIRMVPVGESLKRWLNIGGFLPHRPEGWSQMISDVEFMDIMGPTYPEDVHCAQHTSSCLLPCAAAPSPQVTCKTKQTSWPAKLGLDFLLSRLITGWYQCSQRKASPVAALVDAWSLRWQLSSSPIPDCAPF